MPNLHVDSWPLDMIQGSKVDRHTTCMILCGAWSIWSEHNARRHGEQKRSVAKSAQRAIDIAMDLSQVGKEQQKTSIQVKERWKPPEEHVLKINVDAQFVEAIGQGGTGCVVRDASGNLIRAQSRWYEFAASDRLMEAYAIRDAIRLASDLGWQ